ncbi:MAG: hemolysin family protein [Parvularculaceae bacterium]|nr:hemolysin family protein [Parvularculaceae bacterium]
MEIFILFVLILLNGFFAMSEMALVSAKPARLKAMAEKRIRGAALALKLKDDPSRLLSAVQIGITMIGVAAGAYGATQIADDFTPLVKEWVPALADRADDIAFAIVIVLTTVLSLIFGELLPKRIALLAPEPIAALVAGPMQALGVVASPAINLLRLFTEGLLTLFRVNKTKNDDVTEEEIRMVLADGASSGAIEEDEHAMVQGVLGLGDRDIRSIMTARPEVVWLDVEESREENLKRIADSGHSRFPVARGDVDKIIGIVQTKDLLKHYARTNKLDLLSVVRKPTFIPDSISVMRLLDSLAGKEVRMAVVLDEHGSVQGIVTAADILGAIAGDAAFSPDDGLDPAVQRDDGSWLIDGLTPLEDFERQLGVAGFSGEIGYSTVGGLIMHELQRLPTAGDKIAHAGWTFEVVDMDRRRIDKVLVKKVDPPAEEAGEAA